MMKALLRLILTMILSLPATGFANLNDELWAMDKISKTQVGSISTSEIARINDAATLSKAQNMAFINQLLHQKAQGMEKKRGGKPADGAMLFISFSMPESLILSFADEAARFDMPVVLKGLVAGDFKQTMAKIAHLQQKARKEGYRFEGVSIDPVWFEQFDIKAVPALVVTERLLSCEAQQKCPNQAFDVVYGNISIHRALSDIAERGVEVPNVARKILEDSHV